MNQLININFFLILFTLVGCTLSADKDIQLYNRFMQQAADDFNKVPRNENDKEWVKSKLAYMSKIDEYTRNAWEKEKYQETDFKKFLAQKIEELDKKNTAELKKLLQKYHWITISEFGTQADKNAWYIVQHADHDRDFQKEILGRLEKLSPSKETSVTNYAYLFDRVAISAHAPEYRTLQRYGTQLTGDIPSGRFEPFPMEEPEKVDERRAAIGLPPLAEYVAKVNELFGKH